MRDEESASPNAGGISPWEWLPAAALPALAALYFFAVPGGAASRFAFFVALGLLPGVIWRLTGRSSWTVHRIGFALGLVAFVLDNPSLRPDAGTLDKIREQWRLVLAGILVALTQPAWGGLRLHRFLVDAGVPISRFAAFRLCLCGSFFNIFLPGATGGDAYRVYAIARGYDTRFAPAVASVTLDRFIGLPALILVVACGVLVDRRFFAAHEALSKMIPFIAAVGAICIVFVVYLAWVGRHGRRIGSGRDLPGTGEERSRFRRLHDLVSANVTRPATLPLALFHSLMSHMACIVSCALFGIALGVEGVPTLRYILIVPMAMTINAIPGAPGGVGQGEIAMASLLDLAAPGLGNAQVGVTVMLLFRLSNLLIGLAGGFFYALGRNGLRDIGGDIRAAASESQRLLADAVSAAATEEPEKSEWR